MITIKNLTKHILGEPLFEQVSFVIHKGDKIGLIGPNGSGKSTLLKILLGEIEPDGGAVDIQQERIGYLPQGLPFQPGDALVSQLSGGQKTRLALSQLFLTKPTLLLLDEPTNHLDAQGVEWLEDFLTKFKGGVLLVSHDRRLLDTVVDTILEIDPVNHAFVAYQGGYTEYVAQKGLALAQQQEAYERQQREKRRMELWLTLKRQEATLHGDPAKGKMIQAMEKRLQREIYDQELVRPGSQKKMRALELHGQTAESKLILRLSGIKKSFGNTPVSPPRHPEAEGSRPACHSGVLTRKPVSVLWDITFELRGKERVLLAGENGSGKTTLLKIITGELAPDKGEVTVGEKVRIGYFSQQQEILDPNKTVLEEFLSTDRLNCASKSPRAILGAFLLSGQEVFKKVAILSFGERVRLIFAKITHQENELLVLDEPTNHLDLQAREVIEEALREYGGALLVVSHDRYFLDKIAITRTLHLKNRMIG